MKGAVLVLVLAVALAGCTGDESIETSTTAAAVPVAPTVVTTSGATTTTLSATAAAEFAERRDEMVDLQIVARLISDPATIAAMRAVPRHEFVPPELVDRGYGDHPLPIGHGQTISQPYIVALMTQSLGVEAGDRVLEIGTGSGYQAAVLAEMGVEVYTVEIIEELAIEAADRLQRLGYDVTVARADGYFGWEEHGPYDAIIVTAAPDHFPQPLAEQLAPGGRVVIPIGPVGAVQTLWSFELDSEGELAGANLGQVRFVPFTRDQ